jgi:hypothetical protein
MPANTQTRLPHSNWRRCIRRIERAVARLEQAAMTTGAARSGRPRRGVKPPKALAVGEAPGSPRSIGARPSGGGPSRPLAKVCKNASTNRPTACASSPSGSELPRSTPRLNRAGRPVEAPPRAPLPAWDGRSLRRDWPGTPPTRWPLATQRCRCRRRLRARDPRRCARPAAGPPCSSTRSPAAASAH